MAGDERPRTRAITPYLCVRDAEAAIAFYRAVFDAQEVMRLRDGQGRVSHAPAARPVPRPSRIVPFVLRATEDGAATFVSPNLGFAILLPGDRARPDGLLGRRRPP